MATGIMSVDPYASWPSTERLALQLAERTIGQLPSRDRPLRVLFNSISRAQAAKQFACSTSCQHASIVLTEFEHYRYRLLIEALAVDSEPNVEGLEESSEGLNLDPSQSDLWTYSAKASSNIAIHCGAYAPKVHRSDLVVLSVRRDWGAELTRDLLQDFSLCVADDGDFIVVVDHSDDSWIGDQLRDSVKGSSSVAAKGVRRFVSDGADRKYGATGYIVNQSSLKLRERDFGCEFAFRHEGVLLKVFTRPGVFAHRKLDLGARRLIDAMQLLPGQKVLDIGCGSGVVSFAAATTSPDIQVTAIDSNTRAIECTQIGATLNNLDSQIATYLSSDGTVPDAGEYDVALGNPPYFANFQIAELFLRAAHDAVKPGGVILFVAKQPDWYKQNVPRWFDRVRVSSLGGGYCIATGIRPQESRQD